MQSSPGENLSRADDRKTSSDSKIFSHVNLLDKLKPNSSARASYTEPNAIKSLVKSCSAVDLKNGSLNKAEEVEPNLSKSSLVGLRKFVALRNAYKKTQKPKKLKDGKNTEIASGGKGTPVMMRHKHLTSPESCFSNRTFMNESSSSDASVAKETTEHQTQCHSLRNKAEQCSTPESQTGEFKFSDVSCEWSNDESESYDDSEPDENRNSKAIEQRIYDEFHGSYGQLSNPVEEEETPSKSVIENDDVEFEKLLGESEGFESMRAVSGVLADRYKDVAVSGSCDTVNFQHQSSEKLAESNDNEYNNAGEEVLAVEQMHGTGAVGQYKLKAQIDETKEQGSERKILGSEMHTNEVAFQEPNFKSQNEGVAVHKLDYYSQKSVCCVEEPGSKIQSDVINTEESYSQRQTNDTEIRENGGKKQDDADNQLVPKSPSDIVDNLELESESSTQHDASGSQDRTLIWDETAALSEQETDVFIQETELCSQEPELFAQEPEACVYDQELCIQEGLLNSKTEISLSQRNEQDVEKEVLKQNKQFANQITELQEQTHDNSVQGEISMFDLHKQTIKVEAVKESLIEQRDQTGSYQHRVVNQNHEQRQKGIDLKKHGQERARQTRTQKDGPQPSILRSSLEVSSGTDIVSQMDRPITGSSYSHSLPPRQVHLMSNVNTPLSVTGTKEDVHKLNSQAKDVLKPAMKAQIQEEDLHEQISALSPTEKQAMQGQNYYLSQKDHKKITHSAQMENKAHSLHKPFSDTSRTDYKQQSPHESLQEPSNIPENQSKQNISCSGSMLGNYNKQELGTTSSVKIIKSAVRSCDNSKIGRFCLTKSYKTPEQNLPAHSSRVKALRDLYESISSKPQESSSHVKCASGVQSASGGIGTDPRIPEFPGDAGVSLASIHIADEVNSKGKVGRPFVESEKKQSLEKDSRHGIPPSALKFQMEKNECVAQRRKRLKRQCAVDDESLDFLDSTAARDSSKVDNFMFNKQSVKVPKLQHIDSEVDVRRQRLKKQDAFAFWKSFELLNQNCANEITNSRQKLSQGRSLGDSTAHGSTSAFDDNILSPLVKRSIPQSLEHCDKCCFPSSVCRMADLSSACLNHGKRSVLERKSASIPNDISHSYRQSVASAENSWSKYNVLHEFPSNSCSSAEFGSLEMSKTKKKFPIPVNMPDMKRDNKSHVCCKRNSGRSAMSLPPGDRAHTVGSSKDLPDQRLPNVNDLYNHVQDSDDLTGCGLKASKATSAQEIPVCRCELCSHGFHSGCSSANSSFFVHHGVFFVAFPFTKVLEIARHKPD